MIRCLVSACLLGRNCKYNGKNNYNKHVVEFCKATDFIEVCPEQLGGLATPREPSEIAGERILTRSGRDVSLEFKRGANESLNIAQDHRAEIAILKSRSPSCGYGQVYDGSFSKKLKEGNGLTAELLFKSGVKIYRECDIEAMDKEEEE